MDKEKMIVRWNGLLPVVEEVPKQEIIWDKVMGFMDVVRNMGVAVTPQI